MNILKKVQLLKRALQTLFALNILVLTSGVIATVSYYSSVHFMQVLTRQNTDRLQRLAAMKSDLLALAMHEQGKKIDYKYIRHLESLRLKLQDWPDSGLAQIALPESLEQAAFSPALIMSIEERLNTEQERTRGQLLEASQKLGSLAWQLGIIAVCTLVFGIIMPLVLFKYLSNEVAVARVKVEEKVSHWIVQWFETHAKHGEKPLQDPAFWLSIILLTVESFAPQSRHPIAQFLGEFAPTLRREIETRRERALEDPQKKSA
ncbi:MAG TPA: hypothetical protein VFV50_13315 [Bdellovibrionales bacterium]|nr:hypothetical protein [Bdellovibrionales bacterium]